MDYALNLGQVDVSQLETDNDFHQEAKRLLPEAMTQIGQKVGEEMWEELQKGLGELGVSSSSSEKAKFIRETAENYCNASEHRSEIEEVIINKLRQFKADG